MSRGHPRPASGAAQAAWRGELLVERGGGEGRPARGFVCGALRAGLPAGRHMLGRAPDARRTASAHAATRFGVERPRHLPCSKGVAAGTGPFPGAGVSRAGHNIKGNGSLNNLNPSYAPWGGRHKARTRPAVGEKDYKTAGAAGFFQYFGAAGGDSGKYYYSYDLGAWHIMALNDQISMVAGSPQEQWLRTELANNTKKCTLAYWHRPRFNSSGTNNLAAVKPLWDAEEL